MSLNHVSDLLSPYLDGQISAREQQTIEEHLEACASCREELGSLRSVVDTLHQLPQYPVPRNFTVGPRPLARRAALSGDLGGFLRAFSSLAAALLVVVIGVSWAVAGLPRQTPSSAAATSAAFAPAAAKRAAVPASAPPALAVPGQRQVQRGAEQAAPAAASSTRPQTAPAPLTGTSSAGTSGRATSRPAREPGEFQDLDVPIFAGELALLALSGALALYSVRWWRRPTGL